MHTPTWTFREIDAEFKARKGTAFRAFKRCRALEPARDFELLDASEDAERIAALKQAGRIYSTTINAVVLTRSGYLMVRRELGADFE